MLSHFLRAVPKTSAPVTDPNFNQVALLLHGDGTNGAQNNTFLDSSTNNFSITRNGNTTQGTFTPYSLEAGYWSNFFDGSGDFLSFTGVNSAFEFGTGDFTVECWVNPSATPADAYIWDFRPTSNNGAWASLDMQSSKFVYVANSAVRITGTTVPVVGQWYHVAISRSGTSTRMFVNGVQEGSTYTDSTNYVVASGRPYIGTDSFSNTFPFTGYISNFRILKGTAAYTTTFTPPTTPLTAITNTSLLTCQSNRFVDNSSNNFAITRNGDVRVTAFSPFAPTSAYSTSVVGGSGYFDGTGDYLSIANNSSLTLATDSFTIESFVYLSALPSSGSVVTVLQKGTTQSSNFEYQLAVLNSSGIGRLRLAYSTNGSSGTATATAATTGDVTLNSWHHVAFTRSGTSASLWLNGVQILSTTIPATIFAGSDPVTIGGSAANLQIVTGYISNSRLIKGTALYTANFTPPTAPLTAITNTSLLLNFTNAGIFDNAAKNDLETVGNAQISTSVKKYGTGSMSFDGTGDWLTAPDNVNLQLGTGKFTIEGWVYLNAIGTARGFVSKGTSTTGWSLGVNALNQVVFNYASSTINSTGLLAVSTWYFVTVVREGTGSNQTKIYINGTNDGTGTVSTNFNQTNIMYVGADRVAGSPMNGYIDDLRITKGIARYTSNFTAPTQAFPNQ